MCICMCVAQAANCRVGAGYVEAVWGSPAHLGREGVPASQEAGSQAWEKEGKGL